MSEAAVRFLKEHGTRSLISLGCGESLNRLDNHVKLFVKRRIEYYVAIDRVHHIDCQPSTVFSEPHSAYFLLSSYYQGRPEEFFRNIRLFPDTCVEELAGIECQVVVCQRVLPFRHWENIIQSMHPLLVLQEDLNGCEMQTMRKDLYKKSLPGIVHYQLQPFRTSPHVFGERNIILWRRRDFFPCREDTLSQWKKFVFRISRNKNTTPLASG